MFLGRQPCQGVKVLQCFGDRLCPPLEGPDGLEEPKPFVLVLPGLQLHALKIGLGSGPETSENFRTLTRLCAQELDYEGKSESKVPYFIVTK